MKLVVVPPRARVEWRALVATGAAEISRRAVGTAVFGGMLAASSIGIFLVPMLFVTFQGWREGVKNRFGRRGKAEQPASH